MLSVAIKKRLKSSRSEDFVLDVSFEAGERTTILFGPSGAGKTTTLRAIAGIVKPDEGRIALGNRVYFDSQSGINLAIQQRRIGFVFQHYALFPHLTAEENVAYGLDRSRTGKNSSNKARDMLELFGIGHLRQSYPRSMSGGEQQRTALARALAFDPVLVLLDEPLSAVDLEMRGRLLDEIKAAQEQARIPFIYVTHNTAEAASLSAETIMLRAGRVVPPV